MSASALNPYLNKKILVLTVDGRTLLGTLLSQDNQTNLVIGDTVERHIARHGDARPPQPDAQVGLFVLRGDHVVVVGLVDEELDGRISWGEVRGQVIGSTRHQQV